MTRNETPKPRRSPRREETRTVAPATIQPPDADALTATSRQRIAKAMARAGLCSRREAESWVIAGRVSVNGEVLASPARDVGPDDTILVDDQPLPTAEKTRLFMFHKPRGLVTSDRDPEGRETVTDFLRENWPEGPRVVTIGRLDINTEGLLLLTNDGGLARMLELPETGWLRRYRVRAKGQTDQSALDALAAGIEIDGVEYAGIDAKLDRLQGSNCWLTMGLREGKNREIKRVLEHLGLEVNRLIRISFGPFQLLDLPDGAVEEVRTRVLRDQLGDKLASAAGVDFGDADVGTAPRQSEAQRNERGRGTPAERRPIEKTPTLSLPSEKKPGRIDRSQQLDAAAEPAPERRERSQDGARRHISALRASESTAQRTGPRKRIERTATRDRHDRTVAVERLVTRDQAPRSANRKRTSPAAEGKRVRVARSGGAMPGGRDGAEPRRGRPDRHNAPARAGENGDRDRRRSSGSAPTGEGERPARRSEGEKRFGRDRPTERRDGSGQQRGARPEGGDHPERKAPGRGAPPARRSGPQEGHEDRERRPERSPQRARPPARGRTEGRAGAASGKPSFEKPSFGKGASDGSSARRSSSGKPSQDHRSAGKPPFAKPSSGRPRSDKPRSGKPFAGRPGGRPGSSTPSKR